MEMHRDAANIRIYALLLRWLVSAGLCASIRAMIESILVGLDIVPWVIPGVVLGSFNRLILWGSGY